MDDLSKLHDCEKSHNKIVCIAVDHMGNEFCSYCGEKVDYKGWFKRWGNDNDAI